MSKNYLLNTILAFFCLYIIFSGTLKLGIDLFTLTIFTGPNLLCFIVALPLGLFLAALCK